MTARPRVAPLLWILGLGACSPAFLHAPSSRSGSPAAATCPGRDLPVIDTVLAVVGLGLGTLLTFGRQVEHSQTPGSSQGDTVLPYALATGAWTLGFGLSAAYGFHAVATCRAAAAQPR